MLASSSQGGDLSLGTRICVEGWQNSWQGGTMSRKLAALDELDDYLVKIVGWDCETQAPSTTAGKRGVLVERDLTDDLTGGQITSPTPLIASLFLTRFYR
jgi:hypothetical protein